MNLTNLVAPNIKDPISVRGQSDFIVRYLKPDIFIPFHESPTHLTSTHMSGVELTDPRTEVSYGTLAPSKYSTWGGSHGSTTGIVFEGAGTGWGNSYKWKNYDPNSGETPDEFAQRVGIKKYRSYGTSNNNLTSIPIVVDNNNPAVSFGCVLLPRDLLGVYNEQTYAIQLVDGGTVNGNPPSGFSLILNFFTRSKQVKVILGTNATNGSVRGTIYNLTYPMFLTVSITEYEVNIYINDKKFNYKFSTPQNIARNLTINGRDRGVNVAIWRFQNLWMKNAEVTFNEHYMLKRCGTALERAVKGEIQTMSGEDIAFMSGETIETMGY